MGGRAAAAEARLPRRGAPQPSSRDSQPHPLQWRHGCGPDWSIRSAARLGVGEGEMFAVKLHHSLREVWEAIEEVAHDFYRLSSKVALLQVMSAGCQPRWLLD